jgi:hypothetical protein
MIIILVFTEFESEIIWSKSFNSKFLLLNHILDDHSFLIYKWLILFIKKNRIIKTHLVSTETWSRSGSHLKLLRIKNTSIKYIKV